MRLTYKYRLYPTPKQVEFLNGQLADAADLYNCALQERIGAWRTCRKSINYYDQCKQLPQMRAEGLIKLVNAQCAQDVLRRVDKTFKAFFARVKRGQKAGFPRYRSVRRYDSITFPQYPRGCKLNGKMLRIQGAGEIKVKLHRPVQGRIKTVTIKREVRHWYVCFSVVMDPSPLPESQRDIGIDVGLNSFAALSDGAEIDNPRHQKAALRKLRVAQRRVARRKKGSNRRRKAVAMLAAIHQKIFNQRSDFQHKLSRWLIDCYGLIGIEALNIKGLSRGRLARSVHDAAWDSFFQKLAYKAECAGRELVKVDARGTSQTCLCGVAVGKTLTDRWHDCSACGLSAPRDVVSAQIVLQRARIERSRHNVEVVNSCVPREAVCFLLTC